MNASRCTGSPTHCVYCHRDVLDDTMDLHRQVCLALYTEHNLRAKLYPCPREANRSNIFELASNMGISDDAFVDIINGKKP